MRLFQTLVCLTLVLIGHWAITQAAPKRVAKHHASPTPAVTAAQRTAALRRVDSWLEASAYTPFEKPGALVPFFERLYQLGAGGESVHILHFGDSHTAADQWTSGLRDLFQQRFGNGGSGFSVAGHPFKGYRRVDARGGATMGWLSEGLRTATGDGYFGLGGISISSERTGESVFLDTDSDRIEIQYLQYPAGGRLVLYDREQLLQQFSTAGDLSPAFVNYETAPGPHHFILKTLDSQLVRLFGWVVDKPSGVTYEALGINGAEASVMMRWNAAMLATYVHRRNPGLIVLAYGTNEASDPNWMPETYQAMLSGLLQRLRQQAPAASILVIGPGDRWAHYRAGWRPVPGIDFVIDAQRAACGEGACAFWDLRKRIGGKGAMGDWVTAGLGQADRVHFTAAGYQRLASALYEDLMAQYELYKKARLETNQENGNAEPHR
jgi:hypothetical protein